MGARRVVVLAVAAATITSGVGPAAAAVLCPAPPGADSRLVAVGGGARLSWIDQRLARTAHRTRTWRFWITTGLVAGTVANLAPLPFVSPEHRIDWYTGAVTTVAGVVPLYVEPLDVLGDAAELDRAIAASPAGAGGGDTCRLLADAEARLERDAANQAGSQRWWWHAGNVALNVGVGLFLGLGFHHWGAGAFNTVSGAVIGEAIILTQPTDSVEDLARYRRADLGLPPQPLALAVARGRF